MQSSITWYFHFSHGIATPYFHKCLSPMACEMKFRSCLENVWNVGISGRLWHISVLFFTSMASSSPKYCRAKIWYSSVPSIYGSYLSNWQAKTPTSILQQNYKHFPSIFSLRNVLCLGKRLHEISTEKFPAHGSTTNSPGGLKFRII